MEYDVAFEYRVLPTHAPFSLLTQVRPWTAPRLLIPAWEPEKGKIPFLTHSHSWPLMLLFRTGMGGSGKEGRLSWCSSRVLLFGTRPDPGTLTQVMWRVSSTGGAEAWRVFLSRHRSLLKR
uniref:Uncharacterized protein n=1 Tax=Pipistrellus kuhlii TaxID=59472 RepID=A0A7J8B0W3_PIPKU|nr:hypothetical protein mPipKuh1_007662 [Pipistrellus kuhlii]